MTLTRLARELDMRTIVVDGRERYATADRFPDADEIRVGMPSEIVASIPRNKNVAIVLVAHDYKYELPVLRQVLRAPVGYIGLLGSRKRGAAVRDLLAAEGFTADELARVHTPIGVDLGGKRARGSRAVDPRRGRRGAKRKAGVNALRAVVLEHFRHPRNRGPLAGAEASAEGANPLCGDRVRIELRAEQGMIADARFTADACALCVASASLLTERVRGMRLDAVADVDERWLFASLEGEPPAARRKCATLSLDTLHRAAANLPRSTAQ